MNILSGHVRDRIINGKLSRQIVIELTPDPVTGKRRRIHKTVKGTKKEAEKIKRKMIEELENHTYIADNNISVAEWANQWKELYLIDLSPTTLQGYEYQIEHYIVNMPIGSIRLQELTTSDVQVWINTLSAESPISGNPLSAKTVKNVYHNLSAAIDKAVQLEMVKKNVCKAVTLLRVKKYQADVYDEDEIQQLISAAKDTDMELPVLLAVSLGLRRGELLGLKWKHIDFDNAIISIEDNLVEVRKDISDNRTVTKSPKSLSGQRKIPISKSIIELLKKAKHDYMVNKLQMGKDFFDGDYVICQPNGKPYKPASMSRKFNKFLEKNNLKHIRLHDLRHTNATLMLTQGISPKVAQARLGHSDFSTTMNIYSHVLKSMETEAADKIDDVIFKKNII